MKRSSLVTNCERRKPNPSSVRVMLAMILAFSLTVVNGQSLLLKDINQTPDLESNEFGHLTPGSGKVFFVNNFNELWKTTGNVGGTVKLKAFNSISNLYNIGETLYFSADDGSGLELWKSAGTFGSTVKVKEIVAGSAGSDPRLITSAGGLFYFVATTPTHGAELWKSDGTASGTLLVKDIQPGRRGSDPKGLTVINGILYFSANDGKRGHELWKSDGTPEGTVLLKDIRTGAYLASNPGLLTKVNDRLFFVAYEATAGRELWMSDGTTAGTVRLADIRAGSRSPDIRNVMAVNNVVFFSANDGIHGHELWKTDGLQTSMVKDLTPGGKGSGGQGRQALFTPHPMGNFTNVSGYLFFTAWGTDTYYIWRSDGTDAGTRPLERANNAIMYPEPNFVAMGASVYFFNSPDTEQEEHELHLRKMRIDGFSSVMVAKLQQRDYYSRYSPELVTLKNSLYFWGDIGEGYTLFRSNGTPGSLIVLNDSHKPTHGSDPSSMILFRDQIFFVADADDNNPSIWRTDGAPAGTIKLHDIGTFRLNIVATSQYVYFTDGDLWRSNGTPEGTEKVADIPFFMTDNLVAVGDLLYFRDQFAGRLWRSDGTQAGTFAVTDHRTTLFSQSIGDLLFFTVRNDKNQFELWRTNGQRSGTFRIYIFAGDVHPFVTRTADDKTLYFIADNAVHGSEVWRTNGTRSGTFRISNFRRNDDYPNRSNEMDIASFKVWKNELYISAMDDMNNWALYRYDGRKMARIKDVGEVSVMIPTGNRLHFSSKIATFSPYNHWVTDGTPAGTELINEAGFSSPMDHTIFNDVLYFSAGTQYLWRSDGTACGTFAIELGVNGLDAFENIDNLLVFAGHSTLYGVEPHVFDLTRAPESTCATSSVVNSSQELRYADDASVSVISYPNPFTQEFLLTIPGEEGDVINVEIFTDTGHPVERLEGVPANVEQKLGSSWKQGEYILRINISGRITSEHVVKK